jgi:hypothetical protein
MTGLNLILGKRLNLIPTPMIQNLGLRKLALNELKYVTM